MRRARWLLIASAFAVVGGAGAVFLVVHNDRPAFVMDHTHPFWLEFGRGSGWHGLNTVKIDQTGRVVLHRMKSMHQNDVTVQSWEVGTLQLPPEAITELLKAVESNNLLGLQKAYHANVHDGTQWVLWIMQGEQEKSVYFDNHFPRSITAFAQQLDAILAQAGLDKVAWQPVDDRQHEKELWASIRR
jgi:hypothetical protein